MVTTLNAESMLESRFDCYRLRSGVREVNCPFLGEELIWYCSQIGLITVVGLFDYPEFTSIVDYSSIHPKYNSLRLTSADCNLITTDTNVNH